MLVIFQFHSRKYIYSFRSYFKFRIRVNLTILHSKWAMDCDRETDGIRRK